MFIGGLLLVLAAPGSPLSAKDTAFLSRINKAISRMSDITTAFARFEKTVTKADALRCNRVLPNLKPNSNYYADCAFAQAYYSIDYEKNLYRLLRPYRLYNADYARWDKEYIDAHGESDPDTVAAIWLFLRLLYLKHHDLKSLGAWEDIELTEALGRPYTLDFIRAWDAHTADMLRATYHHKKRLHHVADTLNYWHFIEHDDDTRKSLLTELRPYTRYKDWRVASAAKQMSGYIRAEKSFNK